MYTWMWKGVLWPSFVVRDIVWMATTCRFDKKLFDFVHVEESCADVCWCLSIMLVNERETHKLRNRERISGFESVLLRRKLSGTECKKVKWRREREIERVREIGYYVWDWACVCVKSKCIAINQWRGTKPAKLYFICIRSIKTSLYYLCWPICWKFVTIQI